MLLIALPVLGAISPAASFLSLGLAFMAGGAWAARLYRRKVKDVELNRSIGAQVGAASGGFGFLFFTAIVAAFVYNSDLMARLIAENSSQLVSRGFDAEKIRQMLDVFKNPSQLEPGLFAMLVMFVVGSSIGGAWYGAWVRKRLRR